MTNFDFIKEEPKFHTFADAAVSAERILPIDPAASVINCRRAMEFAVKWMYMDVFRRRFSKEAVG